MSLLHIAYRSILQRGVASVLTILSMALGVMLVVAVLSIHGVVAQSFKNNASLGYNMIAGAKGGKEQLVLNTVYYLSQPVENIPYTFYLEFLERDQRDRLQAESYAGQGSLALEETAELASLSGCGGLAAIALERIIDRTKPAFVPDMTLPRYPPVEFGRHGKWGQMTTLAIPLCLGDYFGRFRVVGTTPVLFDEFVWDIENNRKFEFAQGRNFEWHNKEHGYFEAVIGAVAAAEMGVKVGDKFSPAHGIPEGHKHARQFTIVGVLRPSGTPNDRAVFINMEGFYLMEDHATPVERPKADETGEQKKSDAEQKAELAAKVKKDMEVLRANDPDPLPVEQRQVTAVLLRVGAIYAPGVESAISKGNQAQAVFPVGVITGLFEFFVKPVQWTLLFLTAMICVVSGISILVSIYNSMSERRGEIAVMRALGAGRGTVMGIILLEATLLALSGGIFGWLAGHTGCFLASPLIERQTGVLVGFLNRSTLPTEAALIPALILLAILVGIWPAVSAYQTDVAKSLGK